MITKATGRYMTHNGRDVVVLIRTFHAPIADVWAAKRVGIEPTVICVGPGCW